MVGTRFLTNDTVSPPADWNAFPFGNPKALGEREPSRPSTEHGGRGSLRALGPRVFARLYGQQRTRSIPRLVISASESVQQRMKVVQYGAGSEVL